MSADLAPAAATPPAFLPPDGARPLAAPNAHGSDRRIRLVNVVKEFHTQFGMKRVIDGITFDIAYGEKIGVLGRNGAGKSTLVKLIGGVEPPTSGTIDIGMKMSWPVAFGGGFDLSMSGYDNIRFIARLYDKSIPDMIDYVDDFAELGNYLKLPVRTYSTGMRARLMFALTLGIDFECILIDEVIAVGDQRFHRRCHEELFVKRKDQSMILISHDVNTIREYCNKALVLKSGRGRVFEDVDFAISIYASL
ncbi:ABC transporter ATP-binding protein [Aquabacter spiritensis]|uniref:Capsular polysaccharide transport system ATP-binding protein n=1 Tax=Aquabacter spiritensis TaxID=933073 RepID=A0A4R3LZ17_9HYPH|nr:ATP-binding cassette domain-containing protein [Aquabacter spiritensis]TCT04015.1 capsular polysaccharide transport system ATP-binding protein [Aquabacter spiritensis]